MNQMARIWTEVVLGSESVCQAWSITFNTEQASLLKKPTTHQGLSRAKSRLSFIHTISSVNRGYNEGCNDA